MYNGYKLLLKGHGNEIFSPLIFSQKLSFQAFLLATEILFEFGFRSRISARSCVAIYTVGTLDDFIAYLAYTQNLFKRRFSLFIYVLNF